LLQRGRMAIMAVESATSSKKPGSPESETSKTGPGATPKARPGEAGKGSSDKASPKAPNAEPEDLDDELEDPYDNVACTD
jgi:hypothetical protein